MLSFETLAVTIAEADAYCSARSNADWAGSDAHKTAALRRGQDYIAGEFNGRWTYEETTDGVTWTYRLWGNSDPPVPVKYAIIEAAAVEIVTNGTLSPMLTPSREKVLTAVKGIQWTPVATGAGGLKPHLVVLDRLLNGYANGLGIGGRNVQMLRA